MLSLRKLFAPLTLVLLSLAGTASADDKDQSKQLFDQALSQMEAKKYDSACPLLEESQRLAPFPGTLFTLAECEALRGRNAVSFVRYGEYLDVYATLPKDKQAKQGTREKDARAKREKLAKLIGQITFLLPADAPAGTKVSVAGKTIDDAALHLPVPLEPSEYTVIATTPDGTATETKVTVEKGQTNAVTLDVRAAKAPEKTAGPVATAAPTAKSATDVRRVAAYAVGGAGVLALAAGGVTFGLMMMKKDVVDANCRDASPGVKACSPEGVAAGNDGKTFGTVATIGLAAGAALVGVSAALLITAPKKKASGTGALVVQAAPLGLSGSMVGVRGSF
ncbi:MAG: hypothetical protein U0441_05180 [Polyangiaceae bacterium]